MAKSSCTPASADTKNRPAKKGVVMNPLRIDNEPGADTRFYVRSVLSLMTDAFQAFHESDIELSNDTFVGAAWIMHLCVKALEEPIENIEETEE